MNEFEMPAASVLDRMVDGELSEAERREVLVALDREECSESCGWRRLALAYVEAQMLRQQFRRLVEPVSVKSVVERVTPSTTCEASSAASPRKAIPFRRTSAWQWSVAAICCLLAFGLGRQSSVRPLETTAVENSKPAAGGTFATSPSITGSDDESLAATSTGEQTQQTLRLVLDDLLGGPPQAVDVPVVSNSDVDPREYLNAPPSVPLSVRQALLRQGRVVHEERQLVEVELSDGRRGVVPISDVSVINAGSDVFQ